MSFNPLVCEDCNIECVFEQIGLLPSEAAFSNIGVNWKCPNCNKRSLDMCFLGLNVPKKDSCLNCGEAFQDNICQGCGETKTEEDEIFNAYSSKEEAIKDLYNIFNKGLIRRAFLIANYILREDLTITAAWNFKFSALSFLKLKEQALVLLKDALRVGAPEVLFLSCGNVLEELGRYQEAIEYYDKYLSLSHAKKKAVALSCKANCHIALENYGEAEKLFLASIEEDPSQLNSYTDYINLLQDLEKWEKSLDTIDRVLKLSLTTEQINLLLEEKSYVYAELEDGEKSLNIAETVLNNNPKSIRAHYLRGRALALLGRLEEAQGEMKIVLELEPNHEDAINAIKMIEEVLVKTKPIQWKLI